MWTSFTYLSTSGHLHVSIIALHVPEEKRVSAIHNLHEHLALFHNTPQMTPDLQILLERSHTSLLVLDAPARDNNPLQSLGHKASPLQEGGTLQTVLLLGRTLGVPKGATTDLDGLELGPHLDEEIILALTNRSALKPDC